MSDERDAERIATLLDFPDAHPYKKWWGSHWRLVALADLGHPPIHPSFVDLHYPPYWHYDVLEGLVLCAHLGLLDDPRAQDALDSSRADVSRAAATTADPGRRRPTRTSSAGGAVRTTTS